MRYFIVFFCGFVKTNIKHTNYMSITSETYPPSTRIMEKISELGLHNSTITNIIELSETDFNNFIK